MGSPADDPKRYKNAFRNLLRKPMIFSSQNDSLMKPKRSSKSFKIQMKFRGDFCMIFVAMLAPFWLPFGSLLPPFWLPLASFWPPGCPKTTPGPPNPPRAPLFHLKLLSFCCVWPPKCLISLPYGCVSFLFACKFPPWGRAVAPALRAQYGAPPAGGEPCWTSLSLPYKPK